MATSSVNCLMVTLPVPERLTFIQRSIDSYCRQTLANKSLDIVINGGVQKIHDQIRGYVESLDRTDIRIFSPPGKLNLGQLRNISVEGATGDVLCQWDDDDLYHPERLERQLSALLAGGHEVVYLQDVMQYFPTPNSLYWTNWSATDVGGHPGTLMVRRDVPVQYPTEGGTACLGEDRELGKTLRARGKVGYLSGLPHLFVYVSHGANSWDDGHHQMIASELAISRALLCRREAQIREGMAPHGFNNNSITLVGNNGPAFKF